MQYAPNHPAMAVSMQNDVQAQGWPTAAAASAPPSALYLQASLAVAAPCRGFTKSL